MSNLKTDAHIKALIFMLYIVMFLTGFLPFSQAPISKQTTGPIDTPGGPSQGSGNLMYCDIQSRLAE